MRRYVIHYYRRHTADIHAHFHGGRTAQYVDFAVFKHFFVCYQLCGCKLGRVFRCAVVETAFYDFVAQIAPQAFLAQATDIFVLCQQAAHLVTACFSSSILFEAIIIGQFDFAAK